MMLKYVKSTAQRRCLTPPERAGADIEHNGAWQRVLKAQQDRCFWLPYLQATTARRRRLAAGPAAHRHPAIYALLPAPRASHTCMIPKRVLGMAQRQCLTPAERAGGG